MASDAWEAVMRDVGDGTTARVLADSVGDHGMRLVSVECRFPRIILSQFRTYGMLEYSVRSSRAVPVKVLLDEVKTDPFVPKVWRRAQRGMVAGEELPPSHAASCRGTWLAQRTAAVDAAEYLAELGAAKEHVNRLLEPFAWSWAVVTGTLPRWEWLFKQRCADDAQHEFQELATAVRDAVRASEPEHLKVGAWHLPYVGIDRPQSPPALHPLVSAGRCRRVSYKPFGDADPDWRADARRGEECLADGHYSPLGHPAMCCATEAPHGKFAGWMSYRTREGF